MSTAKASILELFRFAAVGGSSTLVHAAAYWLLLQAAIVTPQLANLSGYLCAVAFSFVLHKVWTFADQSKPTLRSVTRYLTTSLAGFSVNAYWVHLVTVTLRSDAKYALLGIVFATPAISYVLMKYWVFRPGHVSGDRKE